MGQQHTPLWSPDLYALGVLSMGAAWALLLCQADYCGLIGKHGWSLIRLVARSCLVQKLPATCGWGHVQGRFWGWCQPAGEWGQFLTWLAVGPRVSQS